MHGIGQCGEQQRNALSLMECHQQHRQSLATASWLLFAASAEINHGRKHACPADNTACACAPPWLEQSNVCSLLERCVD